MKRWQILCLVLGSVLFTALVLACSTVWRSWITSYQGIMTVLTVLPILGITVMLIVATTASAEDKILPIPPLKKPSARESVPSGFSFCS